MYPLIAMAISLAVLIILLRLRVKIGRTMLLTAVALELLLTVSPAELWRTFAQEWQTVPITQTTGYLFVTVTALLILVNVLGAALQQTGVAGRLAPALHGLFRSRRTALAAVPMMMGMLPTPGGIMLSAPMVRQPGDQIGIDRPRSRGNTFNKMCLSRPQLAYKAKYLTAGQRRPYLFTELYRLLYRIGNKFKIILTHK